MPKKYRRKQRERSQTIRAGIGLCAALSIVIGMGAAFIYVSNSNPQLNADTLCPIDRTRISSVTVLLVDVTDAMNLPQRQDFINQLNRLIESVPRNGKLVITKVDPISERLLVPVITVCNPGTAADADQWTGNPKKLAELHAEKFRSPLETAFEQVLAASGADRSPILESIQSVNLTEFQSDALDASTPKKLVVVSDLLQHTSAISFYGGVPPAEEFISSAQFNHVRTEMRNVDVELWMLERADTSKTQPRHLAELWDAVISAQHGNLIRLYRISG